MAGKENLIPFSERSKEEASALGRKGGINSGKVRKAKKTMKETIQMLMSLELKDEEVKNKLNALGITDEDMNNQTAILIAMMQKATKGDVQATQFLRDTIGENPNNKLEINGSVPVVIDDDIK